MKVLSLFDGMSCGMLALQKQCVAVDRYVAYEIEEDAIKTSLCNFPWIEQRGDVFKADFKEFCGFDFVIGGSPCTYWSIAQKNDRETEASGFGWELFCQFVRAVNEAKPRFFIYENNKSMSRQIEASISNAFGFSPICIDSSLVSAQSRSRLYWVGVRNADGTYSKVEISQPMDQGIYLNDILSEEDFAPYNGGAFVRMKPDLDKHYNGCWQIDRTGKSGGQAVRVYDLYGKSVTLKSQAGGGGAKTGLYMYRNKVWSLSKTGAMKLQTIPLDYRFPVSDQKAISLIGNGWTVNVIAHIVAACLAGRCEP